MCIKIKKSYNYNLNIRLEIFKSSWGKYGSEKLIETKNKLEFPSATSSGYKHHNTGKFLVCALCNIMADKNLNLFYECAAACVHLCPQEEKCTSSFWGHCKMYASGTIPN